ncbi:hypothetical protein [Pseudochelatococcus contaminans]|uniref:Uncharacterized protein n=1 Tax=Pseudochelatococcus contaminans TaxID=1538103 RepID=A0A7W5Z5P8_9HYPH|nr:hypothetical protein [Pseudochelatococcus contaminans]MBB3810167.1 hypothetical protein [Pseudochelatococcus contaminans]
MAQKAVIVIIAQRLNGTGARALIWKHPHARQSPFMRGKRFISTLCSISAFNGNLETPTYFGVTRFLHAKRYPLCLKTLYTPPKMPIGGNPENVRGN